MTSKKIPKNPDSTRSKKNVNVLRKSILTKINSKKVKEQENEKEKYPTFAERNVTEILLVKKKEIKRRGYKEGRYISSFVGNLKRN